MAKRRAKKNTDRSIERMNRMDRIEEMLLRGIRSQRQIANAFNISEVQISRDVAEIRERWKGQIPEERARQIDERVSQIENILRLALNAFDRSRRDQEEFKVSIRSCHECNGTGDVEVRPSVFETCRACGGKGKHVVEETKVKETAGDVSFLRVAKECIVELARLQGLYPDGKVGVLRRVTETTNVGGALREQVDEVYLNAPADDLIGAWAAIDHLKRSTKERHKQVLLEAEAKKKEAG